MAGEEGREHHDKGGRRLTVTVGFNPMAVVVAVRDLAPESVLLIGSEETIGSQARRQRLARTFAEGTTVEWQMVDPTSAQAIERSLTDADLCGDLAYAGGTAVMSAVAFRCWAQANAADEAARAWYLTDEPLCRIDQDSNVVPLDHGRCDLSIAGIIGVNTNAKPPSLVRNGDRLGHHRTEALGREVEQHVQRLEPSELAFSVDCLESYLPLVVAKCGRLTVLDWIGAPAPQSARSFVRKRLFEAVTAAERFGGALARGAVVCGFEGAEDVARQAEADLPDLRFQGISSRRARVFPAAALGDGRFDAWFG